MAMTQQEVITKFMAALDKTTLTGKKALDEAIAACSSFKSAQEVIDKMLADQKAAGSGDKFLKDYCGIILGNNDTGAITGSDAGGKTTKTAQSVIPANGSWKYPSGTSFTKRGLKVILPSQIVDDTIGSAADKKAIISGLYSGWIEEGLKLNEESYGYSFNDSDVSVSEVHVKFFYNSSSSADLAYTHWSDGFSYGAYDGKVDYMELHINMAKYYNLSSSDKNGISPVGEGYLDRTIAHELTHMIMHAKIDNSYKLPAVIDEGLAELTHGIDDEREDRIKKLAQTPSLLSSCFDFNKTEDSTTDEYAAGYMLLRYLAKQASETGDWTGTSGKDTHTNKASGVKLSALAGNDYIYSTGSNVLIDGGAGADTIINGDEGTEIANFVTIYGGEGNDRINNWDNNVTIYGGAGNDTIFNNEDNSTGVVIFGDAGNDSIRTWGDRVTITGGAGNDAIRNYASSSQNLYKYSSGDGADTIEGMTTSDTLSLSGSSNFSTVISGNNLVVKNGSTNAVTIKDGKGKNLKIVGLTSNPNPTVTKNYTASVKVNGTASNDTIENYAAKVSVLGAAGNDSIYNSSVGSNSALDGGAGNDYIYNRGSKVTIYGGAGNDSLRSEAESTSISGGDGYDDIYFYETATKSSASGGDGNDTLMSVASTTTLLGDTGNDYLYLFKKAANSKLDGGAGNDTIKTEAGSTSISGGDGNDYIYLFSTATNSTVTGGKGNDTIYIQGSNTLLDYISGDGSDTIYCATSSDTLQISGGSFTTTTSGNDFIVKVGSNSLTFKYAKNQKPKIAAKSVAPAGISVKGAVLTATTAFTDTTIDLADYASTVTKVNASALSRSVYIFGSLASNSLKGGKGADVIFGGAGNDTVSLGGGKDIYVYSGGNDLIQDYAAGQDEIYLDSATITGSSLSGSNVVLKTSAGNLTVKNGKNKNITVLDSTGTKTTKKYSNSGSSALWFTADDTNFISGGAQLSEITAEKYSVTEFENFYAQSASSEIAITASTAASTYASI